MSPDRKKLILAKLDLLLDTMSWFAENLEEFGEEQKLWVTLTKDHGISSSGAVDMRNLLNTY